MASAIEGSQLTPEEYQYLVQHESDTLVPNIIACAVVMAFLSTVFVALRVIGRWRLENSFHLHISDWLVVVAWVFFMLSDICFAMLTRYGGGRHFIVISNPFELQVMSIVSEAAYGVALGFLKFSILTLYGTIFPSKSFHRSLWAVTVFVTGWILTCSLGAILQCVPVVKSYEQQLSGYCINYGVLSLIVGIFNVITDFVILVLPIPLVLRLNASKAKKRAVIITFVAGSSAVVVSIVRLVYSLQVGSVDGSWDAIPAGYVSVVELTVGFLVVSIPVYRKFYVQVYRGEKDGMSTFSYQNQSGRTPMRYTKSAKMSKSSPTVDTNSDVEMTTHATKNGQGGWQAI